MTHLIINSTGKVGSRVAARLLAQDVPHRGMSRRTETSFDWQDETTWPDALAGGTTAFLSFVPDLAAPGALELMTRFVEAARDAGLRKLVLLAGRGEVGAVAAENVVRDSGMAWTIVRAAWFNQNFNEGHLLDSVFDGHLYMPAGDRKEAFVDADDIAEVAAAALLEDRHDGQIYEVTGPELLSFGQVAERLAMAAGRPYRYVPVTLEQFHAGLLQTLGQEWADLLTLIADETLDGRNAWLGDGVQRALGRQPRDFDTFLHHAAASGVWTAQAAE
ncbi:MAG TPA: NmrA family transcriptional regulator [Devosia sp.]|jgi:uncharacterized protein YbjT (DUF2867 family)|nr:NmrA family transcriptional regulator [Devosia sp.]